MEEKIQLVSEKEEKEKAELDLLKASFKDNLGMVRSIRKVMYQLPLNAMDLVNLNSLKENKGLLKLLRSNFCPELNEDTELGVQGDFFMTVKMRELAPDAAVWQLKGIKLWQDYAHQQMDALEQGTYQEKKKIQFSDFMEMEDKRDIEIYTNQLARTSLVGNVDGKLALLYFQANGKAKTPEQMAKEQSKNSSK